MIAEADSTPQASQLVMGHSDRVVGIVMTLGQGDCGQLGLGDAMTERKKPFPVAGQLDGCKIVQVECGGMHTVVVTDDGKVSINIPLTLQGGGTPISSSSVKVLTC